MTPRLAYRRGAAFAAAGLLAASLTACGGDNSSSGDSGSNVISESDLTDLLLSTDDLPEGYTESTQDDEESDTGTCIDDIANLDQLQDFKADQEAKVEFTLQSDGGQSQISSTLDSYDDDGHLNDSMDKFLETAQGCTRAQGTDANGVTYDLTLQTTDDVTLDGADRQITTTITGTISAQSQTFPTKFGFVVASVDNNLAAVGTSDVGDGDSVDQTEDLAQTQLDRVADAS